MSGLAHEVTAFIKAGVHDEDTFNALALGVFVHQMTEIPLCGRLAEIAGASPSRIHSWEEIPAIPSQAFKTTTLYARGAGKAACVFESSGASGSATRSRSFFSEHGLDLMALSIFLNAEKMLFPDGLRTRILVLAPSPAAAPQMIMAWGMQRLIEQYGSEGSRFLMGPEGMDPKEVVGELQSAAYDAVPVTLIGASSGFVHLLDEFEENGLQLQCAQGSRTLDAGGFKGRSRSLSRREFDGALERTLGIAAHRNVNLLGMTELASQFYDGVLAQGASEPRRKVNAPWTRTRVVDPMTLTPAAEGEKGVLWHLDLANLERPAVIRVDDIGIADAHGWQVLGPAEGAEARGCSLSVEELLK